MLATPPGGGAFFRIALRTGIWLRSDLVSLGGSSWRAFFTGGAGSGTPSQDASSLSCSVGSCHEKPRYSCRVAWFMNVFTVQGVPFPAMSSARAISRADAARIWDKSTLMMRPARTNQTT
eukprot:5546522-Pyramimonas_sp.AAC.1